MSDLIKYKDVDSEVQILKEEKKVLSSVFNIIDEETSAPKYYFADSKGKRLSNSYYSIKPLRDGIHYVVSELDFMYHLGLDDWKHTFAGTSHADDVLYFKFHYGVVSVIDGKVTEVIPVVYKDIYETNSNVIFVTCDEKYELKSIDKSGTLNFDKIDSKVGCVNLDINSDCYGMNIIPPLMDRICDFDIEYKGFAYASISGFEGYLSREIDMDKYKELINLYAELKKGDIGRKEYLSQMPEALSKVLFTQENVQNIIKESDEETLEKKLKS